MDPTEMSFDLWSLSLIRVTLLSHDMPLMAMIASLRS